MSSLAMEDPPSRRNRCASFDIAPDDEELDDSDLRALDWTRCSSWPGAGRPEPPRPPRRKPSCADWEVPPLKLPTGPRKRSTSGASNATTREEAIEELFLPAAESEEGADFDEDADDEELAKEDAADEAARREEEVVEQGIFVLEGLSENIVGTQDDLKSQCPLQLVGFDDAEADCCGQRPVPTADIGSSQAENNRAADASHSAHQLGVDHPEAVVLDAPTAFESTPNRERACTWSGPTKVDAGASMLLLSALEQCALEAGGSPGEKPRRLT